MQKTDNIELDNFLVSYIEKKDNSLGTSASHIHHFNRNLASESKIRGRLKALSNRGLLQMKKKWFMRDDESFSVNFYYKN